MSGELTTTWIERLVAGDSAAAERIWRAYYQRLIGLARVKLRGTQRAAADEDDVVQVAFNSFFRGVEAGRFPRLGDRDDLWQVLVMLTARKAADQRNYANRLKRRGGRRPGLSSPQEAAASWQDVEHIVGREPTPEFSLAVADRLAELLDKVGDEQLCRIAVAKLEGFSNQEIAAREDCGLRTVERKLGLIRAIWQEA